jgi:hypothetical protein
VDSAIEALDFETESSRKLSAELEPPADGRLKHRVPQSNPALTLVQDTICDPYRR